MKKYILLIISLIVTVSCSKKKDVIDNPFVLNPANLKGDITKEITLDTSKEYILTGAIVVKSGGNLIIPEGTKIKASGGTKSYIAVAQGGQIHVNGTKEKPVIMTSANPSPSPGDWGGLVICGKAPTNKGASPKSEVADLPYGGTIADDNSGVIKYLVIAYSGANFSAKKEYNGLSLFGVGSKTIVDYVQSYKGSDDGIEFFGGTVNGTHLVAIGNQDDSIDFADGWKGTGQYWYIKDVVKAGIEGSNNGDNGNAQPITTAILKDITIVKGSGQAFEGAIYIKEGGGKWTVSNVFVSGFKNGININNTDTEANNSINNSNISFNPIQFDNTINISNYTGSKTNYLTEGNNKGAGTDAELPDWAEGWIMQ